MDNADFEICGGVRFAEFLLLFTYDLLDVFSAFQVLFQVIPCTCRIASSICPNTFLPFLPSLPSFPSFLPSH